MRKQRKAARPDDTGPIYIPRQRSIDKQRKAKRRVVVEWIAVTVLIVLLSLYDGWWIWFLIQSW